MICFTRQQWLEMAPWVKISANKQGATDWEIISLRNDEDQLLWQLQGCIWAPVLVCILLPDPHCHWLVAETDVLHSLCP